MVAMLMRNSFFFNKINAYAIPRRLLPNVDNAIKVMKSVIWSRSPQTNASTVKPMLETRSFGSMAVKGMKKQSFQRLLKKLIFWREREN